MTPMIETINLGVLTTLLAILSLIVWCAVGIRSYGYLHLLHRRVRHRFLLLLSTVIVLNFGVLLWGLDYLIFISPEFKVMLLTAVATYALTVSLAILITWNSRDFER